MRARGSAYAIRTQGARPEAGSRRREAAESARRTTARKKPAERSGNDDIEDMDEIEAILKRHGI